MVSFFLFFYDGDSIFSKAPWCLSKSYRLRFPLIICDALSSGMDVLAGHQSMFDFFGLLQIQVEWETKLYGDEW